MKLSRVVLCCVLAAGTLAGAESLEVKKKKKEDQAELDVIVKTTNEKCGTKLTGSIDYTAVSLEDWSGKSISGYCGAALEAVETICNDADGKASVAKHIKKLKCKLGKGDKSAVKMSGDTLGIELGPDAGNVAEGTKTYLLKTLD